MKILLGYVKHNRGVVLILSVALLFRLLFFYLYPELDFPDARAYRTIGNEIFSGQIITNNIYMPLYPIWAHITGAWGIQYFADILLSIVMVGAIYMLSIELFNCKLSALVALTIASIYPHFLFYAISGLTETLFTLLLLLSFLAFYKDKSILGIILLILCVLVRPSLDLLNPFLVFIFVFFVYRRGFVKSSKLVGLYFVFYAVLMSPWWAHQYQKYGEFVRLNLGDGVVLYSGNNPLNVTGGGVGRKHSNLQDMDISQFSSIVNPIVRNKAMKEAAVEHIVKNPDRFVKMAGVKFLRFWRLWPHTTLYQQWYTIAASLLSYGVVLLFSIGFVIRSGREYFRRLLPICALFLYMTLIHMVTIGSIRYRFPLEPFLIIFASYFIVDICKHNRWFLLILERINNKI